MFDSGGMFSGWGGGGDMFGSSMYDGSMGSDMFSKLYDPSQVELMSSQMAMQADPQAFGGLTTQLLNGPPQAGLMGAGDPNGGFADLINPQPSVTPGMPPALGSPPPMANGMQPPAPVTEKGQEASLVNRANHAVQSTIGQLTPEQIKALSGMMPARPQDQAKMMPPPSAPLARGGQMPGNMAQVQTGGGGGRPQQRGGFAGMLGR